MDVFLASNTNTIAATATSQARALPTDGVGDSCAFYNDGPGVVFIAFGSSTLTVTLPALSAAAGAQGTGTPIPVGASVNLRHSAAATHWGAICPAAGTANVYCSPGVGL